MKQYCELCGKDFESEVFCTLRIDKDDENWNSIDWETYTVCPQCEQNLSEYLKRSVITPWNEQRENIRKMMKAPVDAKCQLPDGTIIKPDGKHELDPCVYEEIEAYKNVTVHVLQCKNCGHTEIEWERQEDTEEIEIE